MEFFITTVFSLVSVVNPIGTGPMFLTLTQDMSLDELKKTSQKASLFATLALFIAFFIGDYVLSFYSLSITSLRFAGGVVIMLSGISLLKGNSATHKGLRREDVEGEAYEKDDPSITPIAFPMLAGPGSISYLIAINHKCETMIDYGQVSLSIICAGIIIYLILSASRVIGKKLGTTGIISLSRIVGFIIITIGVEYVATAIRMFVADNF